MKKVNIYGVNVPNPDGINIYENEEFTSFKKNVDESITVVENRFPLSVEQRDHITKELKTAFFRATRDLSKVLTREDTYKDMAYHLTDVRAFSGVMKTPQQIAGDYIANLYGSALLKAYLIMNIDIQDETVKKLNEAVREYANAYRDIVGSMNRTELHKMLTSYDSNEQTGWCYKPNNTTRSLKHTYFHPHEYSFNISKSDILNVAEEGIYLVSYKTKNWLLSHVKEVDASGDKYFNVTPNVRVFEVIGHNIPGASIYIHHENTEEEKLHKLNEAPVTHTFYMAYEPLTDEKFDVDVHVLATGKDVAWTLRNFRRRTRKEMTDALGV